MYKVVKYIIITLLTLVLLLNGVTLCFAEKTVLGVVGYLEQPGPTSPYPTWIEMYTKENPDIQFKALGDMSRVPEKMLSMIVAGAEELDVVGTEIHVYAQFVSRNLLEDLAPYIERDSFDLSRYPRILQDQLQLKGTIYGLYNGYVSLGGLYYNKDLFDNAGLPYPNRWMQWYTFLEAARKLTVMEDERIVQFGGVYENWWGYWITWIWQNGGSLFTDDYSKCLLDQPLAYEAIQWWVDLANKENVVPTSMQTQAQPGMFEAGMAAMKVGGTWWIPSYREGIKFNWDVTNAPMGKQRADWISASVQSVAVSSKKKEEAWKFISWTLGKEAQEVLAAIGGMVIPILPEVANSPAFLESNGGVYRVYAESATWAKPLPVLPNISKIWDTIQSELDLVFMGKKEAKEVGEDLVPKVNKLLEEAW